MIQKETVTMKPQKRYKNKRTNFGQTEEKLLCRYCLREFYAGGELELHAQVYHPEEYDEMMRKIEEVYGKEANK